MDFPRSNLAPTHIHSTTRWMGSHVLRVVAIQAGVASNAWTANEAIYIPLYLPWPYYVARAFFTTGSVASGNSDIGIYSPSGAAIWRAGSTANTPASTPVYVAAGVLLMPGRYFVGFSNDGTTNRYSGHAGVTANQGRLVGYYQQSSAFPLPAAATFAAYAGVNVPLVGITNTASGF